MGRPKNTNIRMNLSEDGKRITIQITTLSEELGLKLYEKLESLLMEALREDLEKDWQHDNDQT